MTDTFWGSYSNGLNAINGVGQQVASRRAGARLRERDYSGAANALYDSGDLRGGMALQEEGAQQQAAATAASAAQEAEQLDFTIKTARALRESPDPLADFDRLAPVFRQMGTDDQQIAGLRQQLETNPQFLTDIERVAGERRQALQFQKAGDRLLVFEEGNPDPVRTFDAPEEYGFTTIDGVQLRTDPRTGESVPVYQAPKDPEYIQRNPYNELIEVPGVPGQVAPASGGNQPRGVRNRNPGNLKASAWTRQQPGFVGEDANGFAIFNTEDAGNAAQERLLVNNYIGRGFNTPREIVNRYAPPGPENSGASVQNYTAYIARRLGIGPDDDVSPAQAGLLAQAMREFENGQTSGGSIDVASRGAPRVVSEAQARPAPAGRNGPAGGAPRLPQSEARRLSTISESATAATEAANDARRFIELNRQAGTGVAAGALGPVAGLNPTYAELRAIAARMAPAMRQAGSGAMSDRDLALYQRSTLAVGNPGPTNQAIADVIIAGADRSQQRAAFFEDFARQNGTILGAQEQWDRYANANPLFTERGGNTVRRQNVPSWRDYFGSQQQGGQPRNAPRVNFPLTEAQTERRRQLVPDGGASGGPAGSIRNPMLINQATAASSIANHQRRANDTGQPVYVIMPDGRVGRLTPQSGGGRR